MCAKKLSEGSKKDGLYAQLFQCLEDNLGHLQQPLEESLRRVLEEDDKFFEGLEGLSEEEREKKIKEWKDQKEKEIDEFIRSLGEELKNSDIPFKEREFLQRILENY